jgi:DNA invertase Pin-like site-specific DNA recombinase
VTGPFSPGQSVVFYARDSGGDAQELSVPQQLAAFHAYCAASGLVPGPIFQDIARPGSSTIGRDGFHAMMDHFRRSAPEAGLVIWSYSRFARDFDDAAFHRADLRRRGYILHSLTDNIPDGHLGRLFFPDGEHSAPLKFASDKKARLLSDISNLCFSDKL